MSVHGASASDNGDKLDVLDVQPAWPQSRPVLGLQGEPLTEPGLGSGDLLIRQGFQVTGQTASQEV